MVNLKRCLSLVSILFVFMFCFGGVAFAEYETQDDYTDSITYHYYADCNGDGWDDVTFYVNLNHYSMSAEIAGYESDTDTVIIPESFEYDEAKYTVTSIKGADEYNEQQKYVEIPHSVIYIEPQTVGYYWSYEYVEVWYEDEYGFEYSEWDYQYKLVPSENFTVKCTEGSAAQSYAYENGFGCDVFKSLSQAEIILNQTDYVYTGMGIEPEVTVMIGENSLAENRDYYVSYNSNVGAGIGVVEINGMGDYRGVVAADFNILPADASLVSFSKIETQYYTGYEIHPYIEAVYGDLILQKNFDYTAVYSPCTEPGTVTVTLNFTGNFTGTRELSFNIEMEPMKNVKATVTSADKVTLTWEDIPCDEYRVYVYSSSKKKYVGLARITDNSYCHTGRKQLTTYKYAVRAIIYGEEKNYLSDKAVISATTEPTIPKISLITKNKAVTVKWSKNSKADGYQIYRMTNWGYEYQKVKTIRDNTVTSWTNKGLSNDEDYFYVVRAYKKVGNKNIYSDLSEQKFSGSSESRLNGASLKSKTKFNVYNAQGKKTYLAWTVTLSKNDIKILKNFAKKHFTSKMSREEVLRITLQWINRNVTYASGKLWNDIQGMSYVEAIFVEKKGQCVQYNGAMAAMLTYLGYSTRLIQGYRGSASTGRTWQHFWVETVINGNTYVFETGNYGKDGSWSYFCNKYSETFGYVKNGRFM